MADDKDVIAYFTQNNAPKSGLTPKLEVFLTNGTNPTQGGLPIDGTNHTLTEIASSGYYHYLWTEYDPLEIYAGFIDAGTNNVDVRKLSFVNEHEQEPNFQRIPVAVETQLASSFSAIPVDVDSQLTASHGSGDWITGASSQETSAFKARAVIDIDSNNRINVKSWLENYGIIVPLDDSYATGTIKIYNGDTSPTELLSIPLSVPIQVGGVNTYFHVIDAFNFHKIADYPLFFVTVEIGNVYSGASFNNEDSDFWSTMHDRSAVGQGGHIIM